MRPASIFGEVENIVDESKQMAASAKDAVERLGVLLQCFRILPQHLADADDGVERRAQLMAHVGEKLRLVLACFGKLAALVLDLVEQPYILDRNRRLVGESLDQRDLLVGEWLDLRLEERDDAFWNSFAEHRDSKH